MSRTDPPPLDRAARDTLLLRLAAEAPSTPHALLLVVASLISGAAPSDALLLAAEALDEACAALGEGGNTPHRVQRHACRVLARHLREAAPAHAGMPL